MKKISLNLSLIAFLIATLFTSCDKDVETSAIQVNLDSKTGNLKVYMYADLDKTQLGVDPVPAGTEVLVEILYSQFNPTAGSGSWQEIVTANDSGIISLDVPTDDNGVTVQVKPQPFEYDQVQPFGTYEQTITKVYTAPAGLNYTVMPNQYRVEQVTYTAPANLTNHTDMVEISGQILAEIDDASAGVDTVAQAITLTFHNGEWAEDVTTNSNGEYVIEVPASQNIYVTSLFQTDNSIGGTPEDYEYERDGALVGNFGASTENVDINFGTGQAVN